MNEPKTPGQAAYEAWHLSMGQEHFPFFDRLQPHDQLRWHAVADAVIRQVKSAIAEEMVKAASATQQRTEAQ